MNIFSSIDLTLVLTFLVAGLFVLTLFLIYLQFKSVNRINRMTYPAYEDVIKKAQNKAYQIIHDASEEARKLRVEAELKGIKSVSKGNLEVEKIREKYEESLAELVAQNEAMLETYSEEVKNWYESEINEMEKIAEKNREKLEGYTAELDSMYEEFSEYVAESIDKNSASMEEKFDDIESRAEKTFSSLERVSSGLNEDFIEKVNNFSNKLESVFHEIEEEGVKEIKQKMNKKFEGSLKNIDSYEDAWKNILDKNAFDIAERITKIAVGKGFSKGEQSELVKQALEEAKEEGFFGNVGKGQ